MSYYIFNLYTKKQKQHFSKTNRENFVFKLQVVGSRLHLSRAPYCNSIHDIEASSIILSITYVTIQMIFKSIIYFVCIQIKYA